ncbi:MAG TPA: hypothetical protein VIS07_11935 [Candidatus Binatia bacterium]
MSAFAASAQAAESHLLLSEFTGADTPAGSLGNNADRVDIRQSNGDVYVIDKQHGVVVRFDADGNFLSEIGPFSFNAEPGLAVDNSDTDSEGNLYVLPEFGPLSAYDASGTLLYQLNGSTTPDGPFGDACGTAVDPDGNVYVADFSHQAIYKFDSAGAYLSTIDVAFNPCDLAIDSDGTIYAIAWLNAVHKLAPDGTDLGIIDQESPRAVGVDLATHHVYVVHESFVREFDESGNLVSEFGQNLVFNGRGVDVNAATGNVYVTSNPSVGARVLIFGPLVPVPEATTGEATNVMTTSATLNGVADPAGAGDIAECHFEYGTDTNYGNSAPCVPAPPISVETAVSADVSGLTPSTVYHFKLVVGTSDVGTVSGADMTFRTSGPPLIGPQAATDVTDSSARLNAAVNPSGFDTSCVFELVDDATFQTSGFDDADTLPCVPANLGAGFDLVPVSADATGLASSTLYHFRVVATNAEGTTNGNDTTFRTAGVPIVIAESASEISDTSARLDATIVPSGFPTSCFFEYVDDATFQSSGFDDAATAPCTPDPIGDGFGEATANATITGLEPGTTYHFRVVAENQVGTATGDGDTFETRLSFLDLVDTFGGSGFAGGQFSSPLGIAVDQRGGRFYVADSGNARIQRFSARGRFQRAWGWGVQNGSNASQVCRTAATCLPGIPGSGPGQFEVPAFIAVDNSNSPSRRSVYVGDAGTNVVQKFSPAGKLLATIDGSNTPQGSFGVLVGVAVDQSGNLWVADAASGTVIQFDHAGNFLQQWTTTSFGIQAIAVDSANDAVYLINFSGATERFSLTGGPATPVDPGPGTALAIDPKTGNLYVDLGDAVAIYAPTGELIDELFSLRGATNSRGLAYWSAGSPAGRRRTSLLVTDAVLDVVQAYGARGPGAPFITAQRVVGAGKTAKTVEATIVTRGRRTTCSVQLVTAAEFEQNGYANATTVPCTPSALRAGYDYQEASGTVSGLVVGDFYHVRVVATNSGGTTFGPDTTFQAGPGAWTPFNRCPVDDPAMLATDGVTVTPVCVASNSSHGSIKLGNLEPTITGNSNLQGGLVADINTATFTFIAPLDGALVADPVDTMVGTAVITATVESAGTPTDFDLLAGIEVGRPILTLPVKIHLVGQNIDLGPNCYIGSEADPIVLHPANTDISNAMAEFVSFDPDGTPNPNGPLSALIVTGTTQGDSTFSVPVATGCGPNGDGSLDAVINALVGLPSPSGNNVLVLEDAGSALALPAVPLTGAEFAAFWHSAFDD